MGKVIECIPNCELYFNLGIHFFEKQSFDRALIYLKRADSLSKNRSDHIYCYCQIAICYIHSHQTQMAIKLLNEIGIFAEQGYPEIYYFQGVAFFANQNYDQGAIVLKKYLASGQTNYITSATGLINQLAHLKPFPNY